MTAVPTAVANGTMSKNIACKNFGISKATLLRHLRKSNKYSDEIENTLGDKLTCWKQGRIKRSRGPGQIRVRGP